MGYACFLETCGASDYWLYNRKTSKVPSLICSVTNNEGQYDIACNYSHEPLQVLKLPRSLIAVNIPG